MIKVTTDNNSYNNRYTNQNYNFAQSRAGLCKIIVRRCFCETVVHSDMPWGSVQNCLVLF